MSDGTYPELAAHCLKTTKASGVVLLVVGSERGTGFTLEVEPALGLALPTILRTLADQLDVGRITAMSDADADDLRVAVIRFAAILQARRSLGQTLFQTETERRLAAAIAATLTPFTSTPPR